MFDWWSQDNLPEEPHWPWPAPGWQCPVCKCVYAPWVAQCPNHGPQTVNSSSTNGPVATTAPPVDAGG
jgi:hypothetical protein